METPGDPKSTLSGSALHGQLRELWHTKPSLRHYIAQWEATAEEGRQALEDKTGQLGRDTLVQTFVRGPYRFLPLITDRHHLLCELDILFLRAEDPGKLFTVNAAGDLDNRLKVLFDALRMPGDAGELPRDATPDGAEHPLFCLLENDNLITAVRVESERLLDVAPGNSRVRLVIRVAIKTSVVTLLNLSLAD